MSSPSRSELKVLLEELYRGYTSPRWLHPDPLELVIPYADVRDREVAALAASSLAYGRVNLILKSVRTVLKGMGRSPFDFLLHASPDQMRKIYRSFKYRFHTGEDLALLFTGAGAACRQYGSLEACFLEGLKGNSSLAEAEKFFSGTLCAFFPEKRSTLLPSPAEKSACKRLNLMLRWLVRKDPVDPGGWDQVSPRLLTVPLDTHMHRIARELKLTRRNAADWKTAAEITAAFARFSPEDPVKYDFALTRFGIHPELAGRPLTDPT